ncbi:37S ribosomal protein, mitochondrial [Quaeritorhiza haematococci]|nr:37S ribosomal protein, mitochondrial [Quaeritorhiza haematococci]
MRRTTLHILRDLRSSVRSNSASGSSLPSPLPSHSSALSSSACRHQLRYSSTTGAPEVTASRPTATPLSRLVQLIPHPSTPSPQTQQNESQSQYTPSIRNALTIRSLMAANLHLGHSRSAWNPRMLPFIFGERQGIHIINLEHTIVYLRRAINITREIAANGGNVVFVGTRPALHRIAFEAAKRAQGFYVLNWVGGIITNKERVLRRSVGFDPDKVTQSMPLRSGFGRDDSATVDGDEDVDQGDAQSKTPTKQPYVHIPDLLILLDYPNTFAAVREANAAHIPVVAICDTDCDPSHVQYPIPANDDSLTGVELIAGLLSMAAAEGKVELARKMGAAGADAAGDVYESSRSRARY